MTRFGKAGRTRKKTKLKRRVKLKQPRFRISIYYYQGKSPLERGRHDPNKLIRNEQIIKASRINKIGHFDIKQK